MKKLIALLMAVVMVLALGACGNNEPEKEKDKNTNVSDDRTDGDTTEATENSGAEKLKFWYHEIDWNSLPENVFDGKVLDGALSLPVDPEALDQVCAPFISGYGDAQVTVPSFQALTVSQELTEGIDLRLDDSSPHRSQVAAVSIYNLNQGDDGVVPTSYAQCFQNGWWSIHFQESGIVQEEGPSWEDRAEANRILERFGKPTNVMIDANDTQFHDCLTSGEGELYYYLVYETDEYAMVVRLSDLVSSYYEVATMEIHSIIYYPKQMWELREAELVSVWDN